MNTVDIHRLKPHPKNADYFADITGDKYEEIKHSIEAHGIRDPLKVLPDFTIVAGHQRWRIAKELGIEQVPCTVVDVSSEEAEYLLIADNEERRGDDDNPMRKAKRAEFLKEYWGVKQGKKGQNVPIKTTADIGQTIGEDERTTKRLLKLNALITPLQNLVSSGKLGTTAAEQLAYLTIEDQQTVFDAFGEHIGQQSVAEMKQLRTDVETLRRDKKQHEQAYQRAKESVATQQKAIEDLQRQLDQAQNSAEVEKVQNKLANAQAQIDQLRQQLEQAQSEKKLVEAGVERLAEDQAKVLLDKQNVEWEEKMRKVKERSRTLNEENQRLSDENSKLTQTTLELRNQEFEQARYRSDIEDRLRTIAGDFEKAILSIRDVWNGPLSGDSKLVHAMDYYAKHFTKQIELLQQITEARQDDGSSIIETTATWN